MNHRVGMVDSLAGVVLAAGAGTRLAPLTHLRPKALCPLGDRVLLDHALQRMAEVTSSVAVNAHHRADLIEEHLVEPLPGSPGEVHLSVEVERPLGTAGAIGHLRRWIEGRPVLVANADTWHRADLRAFVEMWDRSSVALLTTTPGPFGPRSSVVASLLPGPVASALATEPSGLWEALWNSEVAAGRLLTVHTDAPVFDCGTPRQYLEANLAWAGIEGATGGGGSVVGEGAVVLGQIERCVIWPGARVEAGERLHDADTRRGPHRSRALTV